MNGLRNDTSRKKGKKEDKGSGLLEIDGGGQYGGGGATTTCRFEADGAQRW